MENSTLRASQTAIRPRTQEKSLEHHYTHEETARKLQVSNLTLIYTNRLANP